MYFVYKFPLYFVFGLETFCVQACTTSALLRVQHLSSSTSCSILDVSYFVFGTDYFMYYV